MVEVTATAVNAKALPNMWNFRPSAFMNGYLESVQTLLEMYQKDNQRAQYEGIHVPRRSSAPSAILRTCQWNLHFFTNPCVPSSTTDGDDDTIMEDSSNSKTLTIYKDGKELATAMINTLLEMDADVLVLNEFGMSKYHKVQEPLLTGSSMDSSSSSRCMEISYEAGREQAIVLLENAGYSIHVTGGYCPTAIATRLPVEESRTFQLDIMRDAVGLQVKVGTGNDDGKRKQTNDNGTSRNKDREKDPSVLNESNSQNSSNKKKKEKDKYHSLWIYGTHLDDSEEGNGQYRQAEIKSLLETIGVETPNVMIMGTFNQQRRQDYTAEEWQLLAENKERRKSPLDDGVAYLLRAFGYDCIWDDTHNMINDPYHHQFSVRSIQKNLKPHRTNWNPEQPPPSTHWSGTVVDYNYVKDNHLELAGVYVSPSPLSDHRLVVCDWDVKKKKKRLSISRRSSSVGSSSSVASSASSVKSSISRAGPFASLRSAVRRVLPWHGGNTTNNLDHQESQ